MQASSTAESKPSVRRKSKRKRKSSAAPAAVLAAAVRKALGKNRSVTAWTLRATETRSREMYMVHTETESERLVENRQVLVTLYTRNDDRMGSATVTLTPGDESQAAQRIEEGVAAAASGSMQWFPLPAAGEMADVETVDAKIQKEAASSLGQLRTTIRSVIAGEKNVTLASAEFFLHFDDERLENSEGLAVERQGTRAVSEVVLIGTNRDRGEAEMQGLRNRRRIEDLDLENWLRALSAHARDAADAEPGPIWEGPVILPADTLGSFFQPLVQQASARAAYLDNPSLELDRAVSRGEPSGDLLNLATDSTLPFGNATSRCDDDGVRAGKTNLIENGIFKRQWAEQRFAHYLGVPPTGRFGNLVIAGGTRWEKDMRDEAGTLEVFQFSWLNPNSVTGDFASEVRFGYLSRGMARMPFRGGMLTGNVFEALAACQFSRDTQFVGGGNVPRAMRIEHLKLVGS